MVVLDQPAMQDNSRYSQCYVDQVATALLQDGHLIWSQSPRLYIILQDIGMLSLLDKLNRAGVNDLWLPITSESILDEILIPEDVRPQFIQAQQLVCGRPADFYLGHASSHGHFTPESHPPFQSLRYIGKGSLGIVEKVLCDTDGQVYARKSIRRTSCVSINKNRVQAFQRELHALSRIRHRHCVEIAGSYTTSRHLVLVMSPIADSDLKNYLFEAGHSLEPNILFPIRHWFGCLATAVRYLHLNRIRHRDIKPANILVHQQQVLLVDFGLAWDWKDAKSSTTSTFGEFTRPYAAPEVIMSKKRDSSSDIWSLGCVFFEMATVLKRKPVSELRNFFQERADSEYFFNNESGIVAWAKEMADLSSFDNAPFSWSCKMLNPNRKERPSAATLVELINGHKSATEPSPYFGRCCQTPDEALIKTSVCGGCNKGGLPGATICPQCKHIYSSRHLCRSLVSSAGSWPVPRIMSSFFPNLMIGHLTNTYLNGFTKSIVSNNQWESQDVDVTLSCIPRRPLPLTLRKFSPSCDLMSLQGDPGTTIDFRSTLPLGLHDVDIKVMAETFNNYLDDIVDNHLVECTPFLLQYCAGDQSSRVLYRMFGWFHAHKDDMPKREVVTMRSAIKLIASHRVISQALLLDELPESFKEDAFGSQTKPHRYSDWHRQSPLLLNLQVKVAFHKLQCKILKQVLTGLGLLNTSPKSWESCLFISMCLAFLIERVEIANLENVRLSLGSGRSTEAQAAMIKELHDYRRDVEDIVFCRIYRPISTNMRSRGTARTSSGSVLVARLRELQRVFNSETCQSGGPQPRPQYSSRLVLSLLDLVGHM
ncbi:kinase-like domain-containing protein [Rhexocercosporidium sp. MPI-PUGE-AT-0058]|nr:kinase-like domain-containing protein [Rhexocercosporidium sp. MPI-PUGE-AT-0058]